MGGKTRQQVQDEGKKLLALIRKRRENLIECEVKFIGFEIKIVR